MADPTPTADGNWSGILDDLPIKSDVKIGVDAAAAKKAARLAAKAKKAAEEQRAMVEAQVATPLLTPAQRVALVQRSFDVALLSITKAIEDGDASASLRGEQTRLLAMYARTMAQADRDKAGRELRTGGGDAVADLLETYAKADAAMGLDEKAEAGDSNDPDLSAPFD